MRFSSLLVALMPACAPEPAPPVAGTQRAALTTFSFQDGVNNYTGTRDTTLRSATPNENRGDRDDIRVGVDQIDGTQVGLIGWDVTQVPSGSVVVSATATFVVSNLEPIPIEARLPLRDWVELEATWNGASNAAAWGTPGASGAADVGAPFGQVVCGASTCSLTIPLALAQSWVDTPTQNRGVMLRISQMTASDFRVWASDNLVTANRPELQLRIADPADAGIDAGIDAGMADAGIPDAGAADAGRADPAGSDGGVGNPQAGSYVVGCGCATDAAITPLLLLAALLLLRTSRFRNPS